MRAHHKLFCVSLLLYGAALLLPACRVDALMACEGDTTMLGFQALVKTVMACFWESHFAAFFVANLLYALGMRFLWEGDTLSAFGLCATSFLIAGSALIAFTLDQKSLSLDVGTYAWLAALLVPGVGSMWLPAQPARGRRRPLPTFHA